MKVFKRNAVIITVLVFVCVAVYLNWSYDKKTEDAAKKGEEILNAGSESTDKTETAGSAGTISAETSESDNQDEKTAETGLYYAELADLALKEAEIETIIKSKGFTDCVVYLTEDSATVTVACEVSLSNAGVAQITDVIISETGLSASQLKVIELD